MGLRHKPRSSKSRWRKTLDRRWRPHVIVEVRRPWPYITVRWNPGSEEEAQRIREYSTLVQLSMGTIGVLSSHLASTFRVKEVS